MAKALEIPCFVFQRQMWKIRKLSTRRKKRKFLAEFSTRIFQPSTASCGKSLQLSVDIGNDIPQVIGDAGGRFFQGDFDAVDTVEHRGVISCQLLADIRGGKTDHTLHQVHGHLPRFGNHLVALIRAQGAFFQRVEAAHLIDNQGRVGTASSSGLRFFRSSTPSTRIFTG